MRRPSRCLGPPNPTSIQSSQRHTQSKFEVMAFLAIRTGDHIPASLTVKRMRLANSAAYLQMNRAGLLFVNETDGAHNAPVHRHSHTFTYIQYIYYIYIYTRACFTTLYGIVHKRACLFLFWLDDDDAQ